MSRRSEGGNFLAPLSAHIGDLDNQVGNRFINVPFPSLVSDLIKKLASEDLLNVSAFAWSFICSR